MGQEYQPKINSLLSREIYLRHPYKKKSLKYFTVKDVTGDLKYVFHITLQYGSKRKRLNSFTLFSGICISVREKACLGCTNLTFQKRERPDSFGTFYSHVVHERRE